MNVIIYNKKSNKFLNENYSDGDNNPINAKIFDIWEVRKDHPELTFDKNNDIYLIDITNTDEILNLISPDDYNIAYFLSIKKKLINSYNKLTDPYIKLDYWQYFIDTSNDFNHTGLAIRKINYTDVTYTYKGKEFHANYDVYYDQFRKVIQINFEQTNGKNDWITNFAFAGKYYDTFISGDKKITLKVHNGWANMYKAIKHQIREKVKFYMDSETVHAVEIVGWSLGSGQAMLCAQDLNYNFGIKSYVYTFGSVNPFKTNIFNRRKIIKYLRSCCKECYNFCHKNDIVTYMPLALWGFRKIKRVNLKGIFNPFKLFNPQKYHTLYDKKELYKNKKGN